MSGPKDKIYEVGIANEITKCYKNKNIKQMYEVDISTAIAACIKKVAKIGEDNGKTIYSAVDDMITILDRLFDDKDFLENQGINDENIYSSLVNRRQIALKLMGILQRKSEENGNEGTY